MDSVTTHMIKLDRQECNQILEAFNPKLKILLMMRKLNLMKKETIQNKIEKRGYTVVSALAE
uniref:Uncharacterized protein n=1 Tax=Meloidogyne incognita TaxID=6306 RepID=A0A914MPA7_MELIC